MKTFKEKLKRVTSLTLTALLLLMFFPAQTLADSFDASVSGFALIDPVTDTEVKVLENGAIINLAKLSSDKLNVRADVKGTDPVGSVHFDLCGGSHTRDENVAPYALFGDTAGDYEDGTISPGSHTLTATPYTGTYGSGTAGASFTIDFSVVDDDDAPVVMGIEDGKYYNSDRTITFSDASPVVSATLDGKAFTSGTVVSEEGSHTLIVNDGYGNITTVTFSIDKTAPVISVVGPMPVVIERGTPFIDPVVATDNSNRFTFVSTPTINTGVLGNYSVTYTAEDVAGNVTTLVVNIEVKDTIPPANVDAGPDLTANKTATLLATGNDGGFPVSYLWEKVTGPGILTFTAEDADSTEVNADTDGVYVIKVTVTDGGGNSSSDTLNLTWDTTPATIKNEASYSLGTKNTIKGLAEDLVSGVASFDWAVVSGPGTLDITNEKTDSPVFNADQEGKYVVKLTVFDNAGNKAEKEIEVIWDVTPTAEISDFYLVTGNGFVDLHWTNPKDGDYRGANVYRSEKDGELGNLLGTVLAPKNSYSDEAVTNGTAYYYTLVALDGAGNELRSAQLLATPTAPKVASVLTPVTVNEEIAEDSDLVLETASKPEVKSNVTENKKEESQEKEAKNIPALGVAVLLILALVGVYLLYLQNPDFLKRLKFFKRK